MVNHVLKSIYTAVPKTGSSSLTEHFLANGWERPIPRYHVTISEVSNFFLKKSFNYESYFKFAFVRNPWCRCLSSFFWFKKRGELPKFMEFNDFLFLYFKKPDNLQNYGLFVQKMTPQLDWISKNSKIQLDFVGRFENLQNDFDFVCSQIHTPIVKLPKLNSTHHKHYSHYYNRKTRDIVYHIYKEEINYFNYEFES
jgi:hypothetical protein